MRKHLLLAMLIGVMGMLGCVIYVIGATSAGPRPGSYRAAVVRVLDHQRVDYHDVEVLDGCAPSYLNCRTYAATVRVLAVTTMIGSINCRERWITCTLTVPRVRIHAAPLDDTRDPIAARWEALSGEILLRLREFYHSMV